MDEKILILEDDQPFAEMLKETLQANGFQARVSLDPGEALQSLRAEEFNLLVSDYLMPKLEGTAFIRKVRTFNESIPVLMVSAYMGEREMLQASQAGVSRVLKKPFEMEELMSEIGQLLDGSFASAGEVGGAIAAASDGSLPDSLRHLPPVSDDSRDFVEHLWDGFRVGGPVFLTGEEGLEIDPIIAEVSVWAASRGDAVCFDFRAGDLLSAQSRRVITRFAGKDDYSRIVLVRDMDRIDRSQQKALLRSLKRPDGTFGESQQPFFLFLLEKERLALAEMSMDDELLEMVFGGLVKVPPLRGRYRDIAYYLKEPLESGETQVFDAEAVAFLLRYDWPGNHAQLMEMRRRLLRVSPGVPVGVDVARSVVEKRLDEPLEEGRDPSLSAVLGERQSRVLRSLLQTEEAPPERILEEVGCPGVEPADDFPEGQSLLYPALLDGTSSG